MGYFPKALIKKLGKVSDIKLAKKYNYHVSTILKKRKELDISAFRKISKFKWTEETIKLLGTKSDSKLADELGTTKTIVLNKRTKLKIPAFNNRS